jgi:hypothetical protein
MFASTWLNTSHPGTNTRPRVLLAICLLLAALLPASLRVDALPSDEIPLANPIAHAQPNLGSLPLSFMPTGDQSTPFTAYGVGGSIAFHPGAVTLVRSGAQLRVEFRRHADQPARWRAVA